ncbi:MAG TPA: ABC transporter substrate-binding protein [Stellaceae bacterium]|jgi:branched-chain amino acid transport system substrate-binding protein|nr:ABC transporter substrate-binding protein [Stellaceae bacterium]
MRFIIVILGALCAASLTPGVGRAADPSFDIPVIVSLTGGGAFLGKQEHQALTIEATVVNNAGGIHGLPVHFIFKDDQSSPQLAVQLANAALAANPPVILGATMVASCNAMAPLMASGPVMWCFSAGIHPPKGSHVFTAGVSTHDQAAAMIRYFRFKGWTRLALMTSTDATGQDADRGFDELVALPENRDIQFVARVHFNPADVSVSAQIERVKAARPQAFIAWSTGSPIATVFRGIVQAGLALPVGTTGGNLTYAEMTQFAGFLPQQLYLPAPQWPIGDDPVVTLPKAVMAKQKELFAAFATAGAKPDEGSVLGWEPANLIVDALRQLPPGATGAQLLDHLEHLTGAAGVNGIYDFVRTPQRGLSLDNVIVTRWNPAAMRWDVVAGPTGVPIGK